MGWFEMECFVYECEQKTEFIYLLWPFVTPLSSGLGSWGPNLVRRYTSSRFGAYSTGELLTEDESRLLTDYLYHTLAAKASGELCLKYIFSFGAFARIPLLHSSAHHDGLVTNRSKEAHTNSFETAFSEHQLVVGTPMRHSGFGPPISHGASDWKVPTTFIYGVQDWMNYQGAQEARKDMKVPCEIIRVPQSFGSVSLGMRTLGPLKKCHLVSDLHVACTDALLGGHFVFIDNPNGFHSAVFHACRRFVSPGSGYESLPEGLTSA
ncbi:hypothetical protein IFM89_022520 [Coptis chinensis]|uniref:Uncharacterized protein n=1 Tax=Coptis chinensis TaxID=261450 RepID=A0A835I4J0_9MAGN|nr:hypothetical protein IFM89_022520 [Coptis chinensis]